MQVNTSVVIPLYRSARFIDTIIANVEAMKNEDVEIIISDRHCYDDTIKRLARHLSGDIRIRFIQQQDELDWVSHINFLLRESRGRYWRFLPHDDLSPAGSLEALIDALDSNPKAILAYGPTKAIDINDRQLPKKDRSSPHPKEADSDWQYGMVLKMFWKGYFDGAFKGLVRLEEVNKRKLYIRNTLDQIGPERCWLFALCLLGRFQFVPDAIYIKRFHEHSVHSKWKIGSEHFRSSASVMCDYLKDLFDDGPALDCGIRDIQSNAETIAQWYDKKVGRYPSYKSACGSENAILHCAPVMYLRNIDKK